MNKLYQVLPLLLFTCAIFMVGCDSMTTSSGNKPTNPGTSGQNSGDPVTKALLGMQKKEQNLQAKIDATSDQFGDEEAMFKLDEQQQTMYETHFTELEKMLEANGWISSKKYGSEVSGQALSILKKAPAEKLEKHLDMVINAYEKGEANSVDVAFIHDKVLMHKGQEQLYGTQIAFNPDKGINDVYPIKDETNVNERRKKMGLEPLEDALKKLGIKYELPQ